ncbi:heterokaryon incompatibility protein-domain-containing protein [Xylariales sp. AK1849]|nr:heterokaryon incompatibility protein-domain-containing protein [Xylariales sp. AK1849]
MWLIDTETKALVFHANIPAKSYIILSHTWEDDEVSFQDIQNLEFARTKRGFSKIETVCRLAQERRFKYAWVDTCCIDKSSSAELTENINAMFRYYRSSAYCFAHLADLPCLTPEQVVEEKNWWRDHGRYDHSSTAPSTAEHLLHCRWFTRGWTLQELIAPELVEFYDSEWNFRGSRTDWIGNLAQITGINAAALYGASLDVFPVATRLSWAAHRETTRHEDAAYCLLGLFGVYMPLIYGEADNAFLRLQEEICKSSNDLSIFAWKAPPGDTRSCRGIFAQSVAEFSHCSGLVHVPPAQKTDKEFSITNKGVRFEQSLTPSFVPAFMYEMDLRSSQEGSFLGIYLAKIQDTFVRVRPKELAHKPRRSILHGNETVFHVSKSMPGALDRRTKRWLKESSELFLLFDADRVDIISAEPQTAWHMVPRTFCTFIPPRGTFTCYWHLQVKPEVVEAGIPGTQSRHAPFECLVACRFSYVSRQFSDLMSSYVWTEQSRAWKDLWSGSSNDAWRDYRYSPLLVNCQQSPAGSTLPSVEHIEDCIKREEECQGSAEHRLVASHSFVDSVVVLSLSKPEIWEVGVPRRFTPTLTIETFRGETASNFLETTYFDRRTSASSDEDGAFGKKLDIEIQ